MRVIKGAVSRTFFPMMLTVAVSVGVYYLWAVLLKLDDNTGMALGVGTAILLSAFFSRRQRRRR
ncbi:hypothetical protein [Desulfovirgula thermocuniculi]|uniref:hypothetical protein n=1 Tax=Desulfovirgula thermocuniculi TaxID=348842 RepID=UPI0003F708E2|nr:hypothetical protein [Desulfovirgula thermocuniculi]